MTLLVFVLIVGAAWRCTTLVTTDTITDGFRRRLLVRFPPREVPMYDDLGRPSPGTVRLKARWLVELVNCPFCLSVWFAGAATVFAWSTGVGGSWKIALLCWPAASAAAGALSDKLG